jgi:toxin ParE1/3/4
VNRRILIRPAANRDLEKQAQYIAADSGIETALRFYEMADETFRLLLSHPRLGKATQIQNPRLANTRMFPLRHFVEFVVFYRPLGKGIEIVRVLHGARDLPRA